MADDITTAELSKALDDLLMRSATQFLKPDEFTVRMIADRTGASWQTSRRWLKRQEQAGTVECVGKRIADGKLCDAWKIRND